MGVTNAQRRKAPMCLTHIRKEQRGQFSPGVRACSSVMPCSRAEIQLSFNPTQWDNHQNNKKKKPQTRNHYHLVGGRVLCKKPRQAGWGPWHVQQTGVRTPARSSRRYPCWNSVGAAAFRQGSVRKTSTSAVLLWQIKSPQSLGLSKWYLSTELKKKLNFFFLKKEGQDRHPEDSLGDGQNEQAVCQQQVRERVHHVLCACGQALSLADKRGILHWNQLAPAKDLASYELHLSQNSWRDLWVSQFLGGFLLSLFFFLFPLKLLLIHLEIENKI